MVEPSLNVCGKQQILLEAIVWKLEFAPRKQTPSGGVIEFPKVINIYKSSLPICICHIYVNIYMSSYLQIKNKFLKSSME